MGCKVSQYDAETLSDKLVSQGLVSVDDSPHLFILNGCSVTSRASQKVRQAMRRAARQWPNCRIVLAGCEARLLAQRNEENDVAHFQLADVNSTEQISEMLHCLFPDESFADEADQLMSQAHSSTKTRAFLKIQDGCNQFCAYCIVAHLRGTEWSRPIADAVAEARQLVEAGHKEIVLTGIHIGHYQPGLPELLDALEKINGLERIRISSIESVEIDDRLIEWLKTSKKACQHLHLPLQSGCDQILTAMKRPYLTGEYRVLINRLRHQIPLLSISTDLIVGFPGETDEHMAQTLEFLTEMKFSRIHIFRFSPRDGTPAATMPDQLDNQTKIARAAMVEKIWHKFALAYHQKWVGKQVEVLWETFKDGVLHGTSREYVSCRMPAVDDAFVNSISIAQATTAHESGLEVKII